MRKTLNPIMMALVVSLAAGATAAAQTPGFKAEQTDRQTKTLAIGATGDLSLKNVVGDITVKAGSGREATVEIVRVSRGRTDADAKLGLERVTVDVTTRGERGMVETQYPNDFRPGYSVSVAYTVTAPAGTRLSVGTVSGRVRVTGIEGEVNANGVSGAMELTSCAHVTSARTISGDITVTDVRSQNGIEVEGVSGSVRLANIKARRVTATIVSGLISARDIQADGATLSSMSGDIEYSGSVAPKGRYEFQAHSGSVRVGVTGGFDLEARTFSGRVEADASLGIAPGKSQKSLRGAAGNGGAAVIATTFSGNVWIGRKLD